MELYTSVDTTAKRKEQSKAHTQNKQPGTEKKINKHNQHVVMILSV